MPLVCRLQQKITANLPQNYIYGPHTDTPYCKKEQNLGVFNPSKKSTQLSVSSTQPAGLTSAVWSFPHKLQASLHQLCLTSAEVGVAEVLEKVPH